MSNHDNDKVPTMKIKPFLVAFNNPEQGLVVMVDNNEFDSPGIWGIVLADIVQHLVNAYTKDGMSGQAARAEIVTYLHMELNSPTDKAQRVAGEWTEQGFEVAMDDEATSEDDA
jgi:hypothetical protein